MDDDGQIGPDKPDFHNDVRIVAELLADGHTVFVKWAERMTQYRLSLTRLDGALMYGFGRPAGLPGDRDEWWRWVYVTLDGSGSYWFDWSNGGGLAAGYVGTKLNRDLGDGQILATVIARLGTATRIARIARGDLPPGDAEE